MTDETVTANPPAPAAAPNPETPAADAGKPTEAPKAPAGDITSPIPDKAPESAPQTDWREIAAAGDAKERERLNRFASPAEVWKSSRAMEQKQSTGELKKALPENATPEELAAYRKDAGIPETPEAYTLALPEGMNLGEADQAIVEDFKKTAHAQNLTPAQVSKSVAWYLESRAAEADAVEAKDTDRWTKTEDTLRAEWGADYRKNQNAVKGYLDTLPVTLKDQIVQARLPDGSRIGDNPDSVRWLAQLALNSGYSGVNAPGGEASATSINEEIKQLETFMKSDLTAWHSDPAKQERYRSLITQRDKLAS